MTTNPTRSAAQAIVDEVGGPDNIESLTHCATRLRFQLRDGTLADAAKIDQVPGVMGAVPQAGDRFQVVIGGGVQNVYNEIMALPVMASVGSGAGGAVGVGVGVGRPGMFGPCRTLAAFGVSQYPNALHRQRAQTRRVRMPRHPDPSRGDGVTASR